MIDVTNKDWHPIPALLVIAEAQRPGATRNKGGLQFWEDQHGQDDAGSITCYSRARSEEDF